MDRRTLLCAAAAGATGLLAGCLDDDAPAGRTGTPGTDESTPRTDEASPTGTGDGDGGTETPTDDGTETETDDDTATDDTETPTETDDATPTETDRGTSTDDGSGSNALVDSSFEVVSSDCGQGAQRAAVERGTDRVDVDGTIRGRNGCYTAELESATYDEGGDELTVAVRAVDGADEGESCQQCIVDVEYRATFEFEDGTPDEVTVVHDGEQVTTE